MASLNVIGPHGERGTMDQSEFPEAQANGWTVDPSITQTSSAPVPGMAANMRKALLAQMGQSGKDIGRTALHAAPYLGGLLLPLAAGPLGLATEGLAGLGTAMGLAGLGGATGQAVNDAAQPLVGGQQVSPLASWGNQFNAANQQAQLEGAGRILGTGAPMLALPMMRAALRQSEKIKDLFPNVDIAQATLDAGVPITRGQVGQRGSDIVNAKVLASGAAQRANLADAAKEGVDFNLSDIAGPVWKSAAEAAGRPLNDAEKKELLGKIWDTINKGPYQHLVPEMQPLRRYTPDQLMDFRHAADAAAYKASNALKSGNALPSDVQFARDIRAGIGQALDQIPGVSSRDAATQRAIAVQQAMEAVEKRHGAVAWPLAFGATASMIPGGGALATHLGEGALAAAMARAALSPEVQSRLALGLRSPATRDILQRSPRALAYLLSTMQPPGNPDQSQVASQ